MAFKPNYRQQRSERQRAKDIKKQEKLAKREEEAAKRRAERGPDDLEGGAGELHRREPHLDDPKTGPSVGAGGNDPADDTASGAAKAPVETVTGGRDPQA